MYVLLAFGEPLTAFYRVMRAHFTCRNFEDQGVHVSTLVTQLANVRVCVCGGGAGPESMHSIRGPFVLTSNIG